MGWREVLNDVLSEQPLDSREVVPSLMEMPPAHRIALARELLEGTGRVVARDVGDSDGDACLNPYTGDWEANAEIAYARGWNHNRAAMLGDDP